ncbi:MAG TPA: ABC transporter ATP-binding protein [Phycisphaerae bacterium]|nr:ABC transporter ATP-binding protein [Phycisphaerae bacterium]
MKDLWRALKGVWPYRWRIVVSLLCVLGVSLSYASGIATLFPVMKIFLSDEGVHGWVNQIAVEQRLHLNIQNLDVSVEKTASGQNANLALVIGATTTNTPVQLQSLQQGDRITRVQVLDATGKITSQSDSWFDMMALLAGGPQGSAIRLMVTSSHGGALPAINLTLPGTHWYVREFIALVNLLPKPPFQSLLWILILFIFLCIIGSIFRYFQQYLTVTTSSRVVIDIRRSMYDRIVQLPASYFSEKGTSDLASRLTQDTNILTDGLSTLTGKMILEPAKAVFVAIFALFLDWKLCLGMAACLPFIAIPVYKFSHRMRRASRRGLEEWAGMLGIINETLVGLRIVKAYSGEGYERRRFTRSNRRLYLQQAKLGHYAAASKPVVETLSIILVSIPLMIAAYLVVNNKVDRETFFMLGGCFLAFLEPFRKLSDVNTTIQRANAAASRIFEVIDMEPEPNYSHQLPQLPRHKESIRFEHLSFTYPGHEQEVLHNLNLNVEHGQTVAIVGGNGSGKTTLLSLLPRLYIPTRGRILIDGVDTAGVSLRSLRKQIGLVTQETILFADTIYNNIAYGSRHCSREQVLDASRRSFSDEFIVNMAKGYETMVGQSGIRLSGGQRQRIAIARAILRDPAILILDEALSQIDSESEFKISLALKEFVKDRTTFVIAHRLSTVVSADMIVCLEAGQIVGIGTHAQLLDSCETYRQLFENQFHEVG